jgi:hypothetical protein
MVLQTCFVLSQDAQDEMFLREDMEALPGLEIRPYHSLSKTNFFGGSCFLYEIPDKQGG